MKDAILQAADNDKESGNMEDPISNEQTEYLKKIRTNGWLSDMWTSGLSVAEIQKLFTLFDAQDVGESTPDAVFPTEGFLFVTPHDVVETDIVPFLVLPYQSTIEAREERSLPVAPLGWGKQPCRVVYFQHNGGIKVELVKFIMRDKKEETILPQHTFDWKVRFPRSRDEGFFTVDYSLSVAVCA